MAFKFVALFASLALVNAGLIAEQPAYSSLSYSTPVKTAVVQPVAYHSAPASSSYTKTISYSQPKAYVASSYEPQHIVSSYHHEPEHHVYAAPAAVYASPAYGHYEHGSSEQNIVRSAHGTVSHISKAVDTPHSSVRKYDTRVINDGYKTVQYAQPATYTSYVQPEVHSYSPVVAKTVAHVAQPAYQYASHAHVAQPVIAKTVAHVAQPAYQYSSHAIAQPVIAKTVAHVAQPSYQYASSAPVLASKVHYSPAYEVSHASFESPIAHYNW